MAGNIFNMWNVPLLAQPTDGVCWFMAARMVFEWKKAAGKGGMTDPLAHSDSKRRFDGNGDWDPANNHFLADYFHMQKPTITLTDYTGVKSALDTHGPIWTAISKTWGGKDPYGHVLVIAGAADTGVWVLDSEPVGFGSSYWLTFTQINAAIRGSSAANPTFLTAQ